MTIKVGFIGKAKSGKTTVARMLEELLTDSSYSVKVHSLADPLKDCVDEIYGLTEEHRDGILKERYNIFPIKSQREIAAIIYKHFSNHPVHPISYKMAEALSKVWDMLAHKVTLRSGTYGINMNGTDYVETYNFVYSSPRIFYQLFGTDLMRKEVADSFWLDYVSTMTDTDIVIVPDVRFLNESAMMDYNYQIIRDNIAQVAKHVSEQTQWNYEDITDTIINNGSLEQLNEDARSIKIELAEKMKK